MTKVYRGFITKFLIKKDFWALALFCDEDQEKLQLKIKGNIAAMKLHTRYEVHGQLVDNNKYGKSLEVENFTLATFTNNHKAINYLTSKGFPGVTKPQAKLIFDTLGIKWLQLIQNDPNILATVNGLNPKLIPIIQDGIKRDFYQSSIEQEFIKQKLNLNVYRKIKEITDDENEIIALFKHNFLLWTRDKNLGKLLDLDAIALHYGLAENSPERIAFWLENCVSKLLSQSGNTFTDLKTLLLEFNSQLNPSAFTANEITQGLLYAKEMQWLHFTNHRIYSRQSWNDENDIVQGLVTLKTRATNLPKYHWATVIKQVEEQIGQLTKTPDFHFDQDQLSCLRKSLEASVLLITGGPGTGKSTLILGLSLLYHYLYLEDKINIATPTGRASMRLKNIIPEFNPVTLHRLLEFDESAFHKNEKNPLESQLVIIDEMSMVDNHLFASFMKATKNLKKLILVGDVNQLPPVNYGDVFSDLINCQAFATCQLTTNHRQHQGNGIIELANAVQKNQLNQVNWRKLNQVEIISEETPTNLTTLRLDYSRYHNNQNLDVMAYQVIAPIYRGATGIDAINQNFQQTFNENFHDKSKIYFHNENNAFAVNDKIICNRNLPEHDLANGEIGLIKKLTLSKADLIDGIADFGGKIVHLNKELFQNLSLCYACSIHKTQGSEYQKVALILNDFMTPNSFLNKKLIYTAITRAKDELLIIGKKETFTHIASHEAKPRLSTIINKIKTSLIK